MGLGVNPSVSLDGNPKVLGSRRMDVNGYGVCVASNVYLHKPHVPQG